MGETKTHFSLEDFASIFFSAKKYIDKKICDVSNRKQDAITPGENISLDEDGKTLSAKSTTRFDEFVIPAGVDKWSSADVEGGAYLTKKIIASIYNANGEAILANVGIVNKNGVNNIEVSFAEKTTITMRLVVLSENK